MTPADKFMPLYVYRSMRRIVLLLLLSLLSLSVSARRLTGRVVDAGTGRSIPAATVELLSVTDSAVVAVAVVETDTIWGNQTYSYFHIDNVQNNTEYLIRVSAVGYDTLIQRIRVRMADKVAEQWLDEIKLKENTTVLDELVVKATKIKMVMRGDTVVYDASAFQLSQGSMLDALIRQLPGASIADGVIKINGRQVSSLLIDGRDFFNGDAKKALENLPAYTVDKVKAYEKAGRNSRLMGTDMGDKQYVLDVNLKKHYRQGMIGNTDLALGSNSRYMARAFAMGYTKKDRLTLTGQMNNINDSSVPGEGDGGGRTQNQSGKTATKLASFDYFHNGKTEDDFISASGNYSYGDNEFLSRTTTQHYLEGGDTYGLSNTQNRTKSRSYQLMSYFSLHPKKIIVYGSSSFNFSQNHSLSQSLSGSFNDNPLWSSHLLDSLFQPGASQRLMRMTINRVRGDGKSRGQQLGVSGSLGLTKAFGNKESGLRDNLSADVSFNYGHGKSRNFAINQFDYLTTGNSDHRNQYTEAPYYSFVFNGSSFYQHVFTLNTDSDETLVPRISYTYRQSYDHAENSLFRLDQLPGYLAENYPLGMLPSSREALLGTLDATNSFRNDMWQNTNSIRPAFFYTRGDGTQRPSLSVMLLPTIDLQHEHLRYYRSKQYDISRNSTLFNCQLSVLYSNNDSTASRSFNGTLSSSAQQPSLVQLLGVHDDSNPLQVSDGNPNIKNARQYSVALNSSVMFPQSQNLLYGNLSWNVTRNAQATAVVYDKQTGITHSRPENVNGNWNASFSGSYNWHPLRKHKEYEIDFDANVGCSHNVDLMQTAGVKDARSTVNTWNTGGKLTLRYMLGENNAELFCALNNQYVTGNRKDFTKTNAWSNSLGINLVWKLPWHLQLSTDLTDYFRRGYNDEQMNSSQWVWNARLSRTFLKEKLSVSLDGFDILGQLKTIQYSLDEQGRTEVWTNSLPRYLMIHVMFKFSAGMQR